MSPSMTLDERILGAVPQTQCLLESIHNGEARLLQPQQLAVVVGEGEGEGEGKQELQE